MPGKITLISPPDVYINRGFSIILVNTTDAEQEAISNWFTENSLDSEISIYFYNNERNLQWLVTAYAMSKYRYINIDNTSDESKLLISHFLSSDNSYYTLSDTNLYEVFRLLNTSKLESVLDFLDKVVPIEHTEASTL
jgi:hypothetical protein